MSTQSTNLAAQGFSPAVSVASGERVKVSSSGTFTGYLRCQRSHTQGATWETFQDAAVDTNITGATLQNETPTEQRYRFAAYDTDGSTAWTGTAVCVIATGDSIEAVIGETGQAKHLVVNAAGRAKAGATAGWVVAAADNIALVTCPASKTASTLVVPLPAFEVGTKIVGFHLLGQVENSAAAALTIDADLRKHTAAATDVADASVSAMTQFTTAADAILSASNTRKTDFSEIVATDETFYVLVTATTGVGVDIALQGVVLEIIEP